MAVAAAPALFYYIAGVYGIFLMLTSLRMIVRDAIPEEEKVPFVPVPKSPATSVTPDIDPDASTNRKTV